jgi:hypothetical protein
MTVVHQVREKMHQMLRNIYDYVHIDDDGTAIFSRGSTMCMIDVVEWDLKSPGRNTIITLDASIVFGVKRSPALYEWVALQNDRYIFGHLVVREAKQKSLADIWFTHNLLGDFLDEAEIDAAIMALLESADQLDDEAMHIFGGTRVFDE